MKAKLVAVGMITNARSYLWGMRKFCRYLDRVNSGKNVKITIFQSKIRGK